MIKAQKNPYKAAARKKDHIDYRVLQVLSGLVIMANTVARLRELPASERNRSRDREKESKAL